MNGNKYFILLMILAFLPSVSFSQSEKLILKADSLHHEYEFKAAAKLYSSVIKSSRDSAIIRKAQEKLLLSENGLNLLKFTSTPIVLANRKFGLDDFMLHVDGLKDSAWRRIPNAFVPAGGHLFYSGIYLPGNDRVIVFSRPDESGSWNIYRSVLDVKTGLWSVPALLSKNINSSGDEIYPLLSADGKELYFASNGHYGMGGYDLYVSRWDENARDWSTPENLGFPYSSTDNDILFYNSPDGQYSICVSDRYCPKDSVCVIVSEFNNIHIKRELSDIFAIRNLARQKALSSNEIFIENLEGDISANNMDSYSASLLEMRKLEREFNTINDKLNDSRTIYARTDNEEDRAFISEIIAENELKINSLRIRLDSAKLAVRKMEMNFLNEGIIPEAEIGNDRQEADSERSGKSYVYPSLTEGSEINFIIEQPVEKFDYTFKVLKKAQFAEDMELPDGLVYQIQLMLTSKKVPLSKLNGFSPVYETRTRTGKYFYRVGRFRSYSEASANLGTVRRKGYPNAYIVAFNNGKDISVKNARELEKKLEKQSKYQVVFSGYGDEMPVSVVSAFRSVCDKDIVKIYEGGDILYTAGPFDSKAEADKIVSVLSQLDISGISVKKIK